VSSSSGATCQLGHLSPGGEPGEIGRSGAGAANAGDGGDDQAVYAYAVEDLQPLGAAVAVVQWGGPGETQVVLPFTRLDSGRDSKAFGFRMSLIHRFMWASSTSIATGIADSAALIEGNEFDGQRKVIDVAGDGEDNGAANLEAARQAARKRGIIINGLPIMADSPDLATYYQQRVIVGPESFVEPARDFEDYARAIRAKLLRELQPLGS